MRRTMSKKTTQYNSLQAIVRFFLNLQSGNFHSYNDGTLSSNWTFGAVYAYKRCPLRKQTQKKSRY